MCNPNLRYSHQGVRNSVSVSITSLSSHDQNENNNLVGHRDSLWYRRGDSLTEISGIHSKEWESLPSFYARNQNDWRDNEQADNQEAIQANKSRILSLISLDQVKRLSSFLHSCMPGVMSPHAKIVELWNQFFFIACQMAIFVDPLFFFLLTTRKDYNCIVISMPATTTIVILRSVTEVIYFLHILLQFRLAFVAPESIVAGAGVVVDRPKEIALLPSYSRVNQCLRDACRSSGLNSCARFIDCGHGEAVESFSSAPIWASACFGSENENFDYGIYTKVVKADCS
ncbi:hypothetical protein L6164_018761 [Bauhinia variegata]|uniref:Uncharacterized protein n=1 Tax=Bauhinia variegata TaxID=167791 RepID=A0ACB9NCX3_BAUVA|nr:hypothetical protein L6164_018761 [Bauhinia variegata]